MISNEIPIKLSLDGLILCVYCYTIKGRSKKFKSNRALSYHITHEHKDDIPLVDITNIPGVVIPDKFLQRLRMKNTSFLESHDHKGTVIIPSGDVVDQITEHNLGVL